MPKQYSIEVTGLVEYDSRCRDWCKMSYIGHPRGCPNYGKQDRCPPSVSLIHEVIDLSQPMWFLINEFDLSSHRKRMKERNPGWTDRQANCVLYWQRTQRKILREYSENFISDHPGTLYDLCPEAKGVNCFKILRKKKIPVVARPQKTVYQVCLVGYPNAVKKGLFVGW